VIKRFHARQRRGSVRLNLPLPKAPFSGSSHLFPILAAGLFLAAGCGEKPEVLARVGSEAVTLKDFQQELDGRLPGQNEYLDTLPGRKELLELVIRRKIVLSEAKRAAFDRRPDIREKLAEMEEEFERQRRNARDRMLIGEFFRHLQDRDLKVTDEEIRKYWETETEARASHILLTDEAEAGDVLAQLQKGASFEALAKKHSEDVSTARQGGDLGYLMRGTLVPEFENALFGLKTGETSGVVASPYGHHILRKTAERPLSDKPFENLAEKIRAVLEKKKFQAWIDQTKPRYDIRVDDAALEKMELPRAGAPLGPKKS
jgi:peptidyl-prolyl cis-trans isomerase C